MNERLNPALLGQGAESLLLGLESRIIGQTTAVNMVIRAYQIYLAGIACTNRPVGSFLFLGPSGTGKTRLVEALAEVLTGDACAAIKIDCAEFRLDHEISKLTGSPPGYLGHRITRPRLCQAELNKFHTEKMKLSFVLFDEIEKASSKLWNLLLGILDRATLTLGDNNRVDFSKAMIFMTSNLGSKEIQNLLVRKLGFADLAIDYRQSAALTGNLSEKIESTVKQTAIRAFTPEFVNRLDGLAVFKPLEETELRLILALELNSVQQRISKSSNGPQFLFRLTDAAKQKIICEGTDARYGARDLKRVVDKLVVHPLSNLMATGQIGTGELVEIDWFAGMDKMAFTTIAKGLSGRLAKTADL